MNTKGINQNGIQEANRSLIIRLLQKDGPSSRAVLAKKTGLTQATITNIVSDLIKYEIVVETGLNKSKNQGRRSIQLAINGDKCNIIGIKLARTHFIAGVFNMAGILLESKTLDIASEAEPKDTLDRIGAAVNDLRSKYSRILAIGVAVPGPYSKETGRIAISREKGDWGNFDLRKSFTQMFTEPVFLERDANAAAMANWWFIDSPDDVNIMCSVLLGETMGVGIVDNGTLFHGEQGIAGHFGHVSINFDGPRCLCGNRGCLELYCSAIALQSYVKDGLASHPESCLSGGCVPTYDEIFDAMEQGDSFATEAVDRCSRYIGYAIVNLLNAYNPGMIILNDIMTRGGERMLGIIREIVKERVCTELYDKLRICCNPRVTDSVLAGAAAIATDTMFREHLHCLME